MKNIGEILSRIEHTARELQVHLCGYGTEEGDGKVCDCKTINPCNKGGITGCCEARQIIRDIRDVQKSLSISQKAHLIEKTVKLLQEPKVAAVSRDGGPCPECKKTLKFEQYSMVDSAYKCECGYKAHPSSHRMNLLFPIQEIPVPKDDALVFFMDEPEEVGKIPVRKDLPVDKLNEAKAKALKDLGDAEDRRVAEILGVGFDPPNGGT